ncbi:phage tail tape measure protein [Pyruvatibacter sp. HU-CL02332]|uniref:phage tail tape measure protein n=1 Tax=Pyruvatibacter sp. HU-CL02332 TaxID=3127650 RepID=UPI0031065E28
MNENDGLVVSVGADLTDLEASLDDVSHFADEIGQSIGASLTGAFEQAISGGQSLSEVFRNLALQMSSSVLRAALNPVQDFASSAASNVLGSLLGAANGAVVSGGNITPFARGGIVAGPTTFPLRSGTGLMGEAGPEAIMPLSRGTDGRLGVRTQGGAQPVSIVVNVASPDPQSFQRSESQIAAVMSRALSRARRTQ